MNKVSCDIINDILPLYLDDVVSEDTKHMVEEHLTYCSDCAVKAERMKCDIEKEIKKKTEENEKQSLLAVKQRIKKKRLIIAVVTGVIAALVILSLVFLMNFIRIPIKYDENRYKITYGYEYETMCMYLNYSGRMSGYNLIGYIDDPSGIEEKVYVVLYITPWDMLFKKDDPNERTEIFWHAANDDTKVEELRLITGDIRMMYEPSRDYDKLLENSVLLWSNKEER